MIKQNYIKLIQYSFASFVAVIPSFSLGCNADQISITHARIEHEAGRAILIDIRESIEHQTGVAKNSVLLPMIQLLQKQSIIPKNSDKPILLICNTQNRSKASLAKLKNLGYQNIQYVDGGMSEWAAKGWPMVKP
jgi:rhodanese-related sulfurtransferase